MKSLFVLVVVLLSLSAHSLVAQNNSCSCVTVGPLLYSADNQSSSSTLNTLPTYIINTDRGPGTLYCEFNKDPSPHIAAGGTMVLSGSFVSNFTTGVPTIGSKYSIATAKTITGNFRNDWNTEVDVNGVVNPLLRGRIIVNGDPAIEDVICPSNIIAKKEDAGRIIHLKKGEGGVISLGVANVLSESSSAQWCLASTDQFLPLDSSPVAAEHRGTVSIIGIDGNKIEVPNMGDSLRPIDVFKSTDETTGVVSYNFSYTAVAPGMTVLAFILVDTNIPGGLFKDGASFAIQVDDADSSSQPPASSL